MKLSAETTIWITYNAALRPSGAKDSFYGWWTINISRLRRWEHLALAHNLECRTSLF
jgi:hypothetical protein